MSGVVRYEVDGTTVLFEYEPPQGLLPGGGPLGVVTSVQEAVRPAVEAAQAVLAQARKAGPDGIEVKFGIKVSGTADWIVAKAATEANFEITLLWRSPGH